MNLLLLWIAVLGAAGASSAVGAAINGQLLVALRACAQALQFVDCLGDEWVREGQLRRHAAIKLPLDTFLKAK
jgi:hypothetical protein